MSRLTRDLSSETYVVNPGRSGAPFAFLGDGQCARVRKPGRELDRELLEPEGVDHIGIVVDDDPDVPLGAYFSQGLALERSGWPVITIEAHQEPAAGESVAYEPGAGEGAIPFRAAGQIERIVRR
jgi:hypothetical protein